MPPFCVCVMESVADNEYQWLYSPCCLQGWGWQGKVDHIKYCRRIELRIELLYNSLSKHEIWPFIQYLGIKSSVYLKYFEMYICYCTAISESTRSDDPEELPCCLILKTLPEGGASKRVFLPSL